MESDNLSGAYLFVYGSLKRGGIYHYILKNGDADFVGEANLITPYPLVQKSYPCLLDQPGQGDYVYGELFKVNSTETWGDLDWLEDHPTIYRRRIDLVECRGTTYNAWTYFYIV